MKIKTRPLRLAFLVDPNNKKAIRKAIQINSSLWGGNFNPLVPMFKRMPKYWDTLKKKTKPIDISLGYIEAFDPDAIINCTKDVPEEIKKLGLEIVNVENIWGDFFSKDEYLVPQIGVGVFELLNPIYDEFFQYKMRFPKKLVVPEIPKETPLFWASLFGEYPAPVAKYIKENYQKSFDIENMRLGIDEIEKLYTDKYFSPRRVTRYNLETFGGGRGFRDGYIFYMDADKGIDIIDFWNLRAADIKVVPAPMQLGNDSKLQEIIKKYIKSVHKPSRHNPKIYDHTTFLKSRSVSMESMKDYADSLKLNTEKTNDQDITYSFQHWYPRMWEEWGRDKDRAEPSDILYKEREIEVDDEAENLHIKSTRPEFVHKYSGYGSLRYADEIETSFYGRNKKILAQVFPRRAGQNVLRVISEFAFEKKLRMGRHGLVRLIKNYVGDYLTIPSAEKIFFAWLNDLGYEVKLSSPGIIAKQLYEKLNGFPRLIGNEKLLKLVESMNIGALADNGMAVGEIARKLNEVRKGNVNGFLNSLVDKGIFKIGAKIQCPKCMRNSFYEINNLNERLACPKCLTDFPVMGNISNNCWHYKTVGPFSISRYADGGYGVLLAVDFFMTIMHGLRVTPCFSFLASKNGKTLEADFGIFWQESFFSEISEGTIFGECKTYNKFEKKDYARMRELAKNFPGAIIAFCTLRDKLDKDEIREITKIAKKGRKYAGNDKPTNPVLILTGTEIFGYMAPPHCWEKRGLEKKFDRIYGLLDICDATQQVYLNLPSWHKDWSDEFLKKKPKKGKN